MVGAGKLIFFSDRLETRRDDTHGAGGDDLFGDALSIPAGRFPGVAKIFDRPSYLSDSKFLRDLAHHLHHSRMRMRMFVGIEMTKNYSGTLDFLDLGLQLALNLVGFDHPRTHASNEQGERV